jgi:hypothetical protein
MRLKSQQTLLDREEVHLRRLGEQMNPFDFLIPSPRPSP